MSTTKLIAESLMRLSKAKRATVPSNLNQWLKDKRARECEPTEHDCPKCGEHFSTCVCEEVQ